MMTLPMKYECIFKFLESHCKFCSLQSQNSQSKNVWTNILSDTSQFLTLDVIRIISLMVYQCCLALLTYVLIRKQLSNDLLAYN